MKNYITIALLLCSIGAWAQPKKDTTKVKYNYTVTISTAEFQNLMQLANEYKTAIMYVPGIKDEQKPTIYKQIEAYLLTIKPKIDSVKIVVPKTK